MSGAETRYAIETLLERKRDGGELAEDEIRWLIAGFVDGRLTRAQAAAFLAFVFIRGMSEDEKVALTLAMRDSGEVLSWNVDGRVVDKHSTGGVGDKVSLVLAPLWAELGACVPMISGRGLGHTGGTLDKLESIPGYRTDLDTDRLHEILLDVGCFINGQTRQLAPADRFLYALRNETATVPSIPLITASILSKKLAEGIDELSLDVKWGSGAFMKTRAEGQALADSLVAVGTGAGVHTRARLTDMNQPLGRTIGNALEVEEAVACLKGEGPEDLASLTCELIGHDPEEIARARQVLDRGGAYERWCRMVRAHGGDPEAPLLGGGCAELVVEAPADGTVTRCDAYDLGRAAFLLGAGRRTASDPVHPGVGLRLHATLGETVVAGQPLATVYHADRGLDAALALVRRGFAIG
ncbi:MAG: thymidine phosphorylase [Deltaproteobacteria bacterium]|nr:MAG: thymidine phosphorylase [Deltaproteobacteria bacterium]